MGWIRTLMTPHRILSGHCDISIIVCAVAGFKPMLHNTCIYGSIPGRAGVITFYTDKTGIYDLAVNNEDILFYWERELSIKTKQRLKIQATSRTYKNRGRPAKDSCDGVITDGEIWFKIYTICKLVLSGKPVSAATQIHGLDESMFRYYFNKFDSEGYQNWQDSKTLPHKSLTDVFVFKTHYITTQDNEEVLI